MLKTIKDVSFIPLGGFFSTELLLPHQSLELKAYELSTKAT